MAGAAFDFPLLTILLPCVVFGALSAGLFFRNYDFDWDRAWSDQKVEGWQTVGSIRDMFGMEWRQNGFILQSDGTNLLNKENLQFLSKIDADIRSFNVTVAFTEQDLVEKDGQGQGGKGDGESEIKREISFSFEDLCDKRGDGTCSVVSVVDMYTNAESFGTPSILYPTHFKFSRDGLLLDVFPSVTLAVGGEVQLQPVLGRAGDGETGSETRRRDGQILESATAVSFSWTLDELQKPREVVNPSALSERGRLGRRFTPSFLKRACDEWEREFLRRCFLWSDEWKTRTGGRGEAAPFASISTDIEGPKATAVPVYIIVLSAAAVTAFVGLLTFSTDLPASKVFSGLFGVLAAGLGWFAGTGLANFAGVPWAGGGDLVPFLVLGIGVDDCFIILNAYLTRVVIRQSGGRMITPEERGESAKRRLQGAVGESGLVITLTTVTTIICFAISISSPYDAIRWFAMNMIASLAIGYVCAATVFVAALGLDCRREAFGERGYVRTFCRLLSANPFRPMPAAFLANSNTNSNKEKGKGDWERQKKRQNTTVPVNTEVSGLSLPEVSSSFVIADTHTHLEAHPSSSSSSQIHGETDGGNGKATEVESRPETSTRTLRDFSHEEKGRERGDGDGGKPQGGEKETKSERALPEEVPPSCDARVLPPCTPFKETEIESAQAATLSLEAAAFLHPTRWGSLSFLSFLCCGTRTVQSSVVLCSEKEIGARKGDTEAGRDKNELSVIGTKMASAVRDAVAEPPRQPARWLRVFFRDWWGRALISPLFVFPVLCVYCALVVMVPLLLPTFNVGTTVDFLGDSQSYAKTFSRLHRNSFPWNFVAGPHGIMEMRNEAGSGAGWGSKDSIEWFQPEIRTALVESCERLRDLEGVMLQVSPMCFFLNRVAVLLSSDEEVSGKSSVSDPNKKREVRELRRQLVEWLRSPIGRRFAADFIFWPPEGETSDGEEKDEKVLRVFRSTLLYRNSWIRFMDGHRELERVRETASSKFFIARLGGPFHGHVESSVTLLESIKLSVIVAVVSVFVTVALFVSPLTGLVGVFGVASVYALLLGSLAALGLSLDTVVGQVITLAAGFSVDFIAHVAAFFHKAEGSSRRHKVVETMGSVGSAVFVAGVSSFIAAVPPSTLRYSHPALGPAAVTLVLLFFIALVHALCFVPIVLSFFGPFSRGKAAVDAEKRVTVVEQLVLAGCGRDREAEEGTGRETGKDSGRTGGPRSSGALESEE